MYVNTDIQTTSEMFKSYPSIVSLTPYRSVRIYVVSS